MLDLIKKELKSPIPPLMKTPFQFLAPIFLVVLSSCSSVKETAANLKAQAGIGEPKLRLTKANPSRFLPEGTTAEKLLSKNLPKQAAKEETRLLAKNTLPTKKRIPSKSVPQKKVRTKTVKTPKKVVAEVPYIELPPLPKSSTDDNQGYQGILPSLDGSDEATFIDIDGKALELPPMEFPEPEEEPNPAASA